MKRKFLLTFVMYLLLITNISAQNELCFTAQEDNAEISFKIGDETTNCQVFLNSATDWSDYTSEEIITLQNGETVRFKADYQSTQNNQVGQFIINNGAISASGNVTSLIGGSDIVSKNAFQNLFSGCNALTTAPNMSDITEISDNGCHSMFSDCENLTQGPDLSGVTADKFGTNSCSLMMKGCKKLEYIKVGFSSWANNGFTNWVSGVETNDGIFECPSDLEKKYGKNYIPSNWEAYYIKSVSDSKVTLKKSDNKIITINETKILYNDVVTIEPNTGYELTSAKYYTASNSNGVTISDGSFTMPQEDITKLEIKLEASKYAIKYYTDKNHKTKISLTPANYYYGKGATLSTELDKINEYAPTGYSFECWLDEDEIEVTEISAASTGDKVFYPKWKGAEYKIEYKSNGFVISDLEPQKYSFGEETELPTADAIEQYAQTGYTFVGWDDGYGNICKKITPDKSGNVSFTAKWTEKEYTITYRSDYSIIENLTPNSYIYGQGVSKLPSEKDVANATTVPDGCEFKGWKEATTGNTIKSISETSAEDLILDAIWEGKTYSIKYYDENKQLKKLSPKTYVYGVGEENLPESTGNEHKGYEFLGWVLKGEEDVVSSISEQLFGDIELYAKWQPIEYNVYYKDGNNLVNPINPVEKYTYGTGATLPTEISETKDGYTFNGWKNSNGDQVSEISKEDIGDLTFSVVWKANTYSIIYKDGEEELTNLNPSSYIYSEGAILPTSITTTKKGHTFVGWTNLNGETVSKIGDTELGNLTFQAIWQPNTYSITYKDDVTEIGGISPNEYVYGVGVELPTSISLTKEGYTFNGWEDVYKNKVTSVTTTDIDNLTFKIIWQPNTYAITYKDGETELTNETPSEYTYSEGATLPTTISLSKDGQTFDGWKDAQGNKVATISTTTLGDLEFVAQWKLNEYSISYYDEYKPITDVNPTKYTYSEGATLPTSISLTKPGYKFIGWKDENGNAITSISTTSFRDVTCYAIWEAIVYEVKCDENTTSDKATATINDQVTFTFADYTSNLRSFVSATVNGHQIEVNNLTSTINMEDYINNLFVTTVYENIYVAIYDNNKVKNLYPTQGVAGVESKFQVIDIEGKTPVVKVNGEIVELSSDECYHFVFSDQNYIEVEYLDFTINDVKVDDLNYCAGDKMNLTITTTGDVVSCEITFDNDIISPLYIPATGNKLMAEFEIPSELATGKYTGSVRLKDMYGVYSKAKVFTFEVAHTRDLIVQRYDDVLVVDNYEDQYVGYQWLNNGIPMYGETKQFLYLTENNGGAYSVIITDKLGNNIETCSVKPSMPIQIDKASHSVKIYPNPIKAGEIINIQLENYLEEELPNAQIQIYNNKGTMAKVIKGCNENNQITLPAGTYSGSVLLNNQKVSFKFIITE